jgi:glycosyltransferase involved in cell wall biosynthesis
MQPDLHIAHLNANRDWGGGENQILNLVESLHADGVRTTLIAREGGMLATRAHALELPVVLFSKRGGVVQVAQHCSALGIDLLHVHDSASTSIGVKVGRRLDLPVVLSRRVASPLRRNPFSRRKYSPRSLAGVLAISQTVRDVFKRCTNFPDERLFVVPSGVKVGELDAVARDADFRRTYARGTYLVGGVGKLSSKKNWGMLVATAAALGERGMDVNWVIAGDGPEEAALDAMITEHGLQDRIHLLGFREDAKQIIKSLDVLLFPSLMEGASVTVREAMLLGTPVVAVDAAGTMESLDGHGIGIKPGDVSAAADAVHAVLTDTDKRQSMIAGARRSALARFSFPVTVAGTLAAYRRTWEWWEAGRG